jgi:hypothetical protein
MVMDELVQTRELEPLPIELEKNQPIEFELVYNYLTPDNIERTYVLIHHYHNVFV